MSVEPDSLSLELETRVSLGLCSTVHSISAGLVQAAIAVGVQPQNQFPREFRGSEERGEIRLSSVGQREKGVGIGR